MLLTIAGHLCIAAHDIFRIIRTSNSSQSSYLWIQSQIEDELFRQQWGILYGAVADESSRDESALSSTYQDRI